MAQQKNSNVRMITRSQAQLINNSSADSGKEVPQQAGPSFSPDTQANEPTRLPKPNLSTPHPHPAAGPPCPGAPRAPRMTTYNKEAWIEAVELATPKSGTQSGQVQARNVANSRFIRRSLGQTLGRDSDWEDMASEHEMYACLNAPYISMIGVDQQ